MKRSAYFLNLVAIVLTLAAPQASWARQDGRDKTAAKLAQAKLLAALRVEIYPGISNAIQENGDPCVTVFKPYKAKDMTPAAALANPFRLDWASATDVKFEAGEEEKKNPWWRNWIQVSVKGGGYVPIHVAKSQVASALEAANELKAVCKAR